MLWRGINSYIISLEDSNGVAEAGRPLNNNKDSNGAAETRIPVAKRMNIIYPRNPVFK